MGSHPINLALRFVLEMCALIALAIWGWRTSETWTRFLFAIGIPLITAAVWATFAVADDPSRSGAAPVPVPGVLRLILELAIFTAACWALYDLEMRGLALALAVTVIVHYAVSYDRVLWLVSR